MNGHQQAGNIKKLYRACLPMTAPVHYQTVTMVIEHQDGDIDVISVINTTMIALVVRADRLLKALALFDDPDDCICFWLCRLIAKRY